jgi:hypothetical protein
VFNIKYSSVFCINKSPHSVQHKIYLYKILRNTLCWTMWGNLFSQNSEEKLYVEHCGEIYLHKILRNTLCWTLGRFIYTKYWGITLCWTLWGDLLIQNTEEYFMLNTVGRFIYTKYWGILNVEHCGEIYLHKILRNTLCWTLWENYSITKYFV